MSVYYVCAFAGIFNLHANMKLIHTQGLHIVDCDKLTASAFIKPLNSQEKLLKDSLFTILHSSYRVVLSTKG